MSNEKAKKQKSDAPVQPDPETLHTTDPQDEMKGPVSSFMNNVKEGVEEEGKRINPDPEDDTEKNEKG
jgi:hypothetical protein